ncbi:hypothetical protein D3C85_1532620 [compost metagenome]
MLGVLPLGTGDDLFKPIQMLEPGEQGLPGQARRAGKQTHAMLRVRHRIGSRRTALHNAPRLRQRIRSVTAQTVATGDDQLEHAFTQRTGIAR